MQRICIGMVAVLLAAGIPGCISLPAQPFVVQGKATEITTNGSCFVWQADDGTVYILYQTTTVSNSDFDTIVTPGVRSRLELQPRTDLGRPCVPGATIVDVNRVLQIVQP